MAIWALLRRLNRPLPGDPYGFPLRVKLVQTGEAVADNAWASKGRLGGSLGLGAVDADFFFKTAPVRTWLWWTVVEQPGSDAKAVGIPRIKEYIYIDAVSGKSTSTCLSPARHGRVPC